MTNEESLNFYVERNDYQSTLSTSMENNNDNKDLCYQNHVITTLGNNNSNNDTLC